MTLVSLEVCRLSWWHRVTSVIIDQCKNTCRVVNHADGKKVVTFNAHLIGAQFQFRAAERMAMQILRAFSAQNDR